MQCNTSFDPTNRVQIVTPDGKYLNTTGWGDGADGIAIDAQDNIYIISYPSVITKFAALKP